MVEEYPQTTETTSLLHAPTQYDFHHTNSSKGDKRILLSRVLVLTSKRLTYMSLAVVRARRIIWQIIPPILSRTACSVLGKSLVEKSSYISHKQTRSDNVGPIHEDETTGKSFSWALWVVLGLGLPKVYYELLTLTSEQFMSRR